MKEKKSFVKDVKQILSRDWIKKKKQQQNNSVNYKETNKKTKQLWLTKSDYTVSTCNCMQ